MLSPASFPLSAGSEDVGLLSEREGELPDPGSFRPCFSVELLVLETGMELSARSRASSPCEHPHNKTAHITADIQIVFLLMAFPPLQPHCTISKHKLQR